MLIVGLAAAVLFFGTNPGNPSRGDPGSIFELDGKMLYPFCTLPPDCADGANPTGPLVVVPTAQSSGSYDIYGTTRFGGTHNEAGVIFELVPAGEGIYGETVVYDFCSKANCADGRNPDGNLALQPDGTLVGQTATGGSHGHGTVWQFDPKTHALRVLESCNTKGCRAKT